jgi:phosphoribosylaminoimidazolecarboxamide formyltransferase / IMP cyclohydrolase
MSCVKRISTALITVYYKDGLDQIVHQLNNYGVKIYSTGGTLSYIEDCGVPVEPVETITGYPSILGGRVKRFIQKFLGVCLLAVSNENDLFQMQEYQIPEIDLVSC